MSGEEAVDFLQLLQTRFHFGDELRVGAGAKRPCRSETCIDRKSVV